MITIQDIEILNHQDNKTLTHWACELNDWKWPAEIPDEENPAIAISNTSRRMELIERITMRVGEKEIMRTHWERQRFDLSEFEEFWHVNYESKNPQEIETYRQKRREKYIDAANRLSLTGHSRKYYKRLSDEKNKDIGMNLVGSVGFMRRELFNSVEFVNVYDQSQIFPNMEAAIKYYSELFEVVQQEDGEDETRLWLKNKNVHQSCDTKNSQQKKVLDKDCNFAYIAY